MAPDVTADAPADRLVRRHARVRPALGRRPPRGAAVCRSRRLRLPAVPRTVVVLVDGLGHDLLRQRSGHAPFLRSHLPTAHRVPCGFPSTTATSMGTFGTGLPPGSHGLVGMQVLDPATDRLLNELSWEDGPDPRAWQPNETVFEAAENDGVSVTMVGPHYFDGSGLTTAALRGGRFRAARSLEDRVDAAVAAVRATPRSLVYLYWGEVDKVGHVHGCQSWQWGDEVESVDAALRQLAARVPDDTSIVVTADHGMVDVPFHDRIDLVHEPALMAGVRHLGGEPRNLQLYTEPGATADVEAAWASRLGLGARSSAARGSSTRAGSVRCGPRSRAGSGTSSSSCAVPSPSSTPDSCGPRSSRCSACTGRPAMRNSPCRWSWCRPAAAPRVVPRRGGTTTTGTASSASLVDPCRPSSATTSGHSSSPKWTTAREPRMTTRDPIRPSTSGPRGPSQPSSTTLSAAEDPGPKSRGGTPHAGLDVRGRALLGVEAAGSAARRRGDARRP